MQIKKIHIIEGVGVLLFFLMLSYFLFNWVMNAAVHSKKEVLVPDLSKMTLFESVKILSKYNLGLKLDGEEFNRDLPAGTVIRQTPYAGMTAKEGKVVRVIISQGGEFVYIPNLSGQPARLAGISLRSAGLSLGEESSKYSLYVEKGNVLSQDPKPGVVAEKDSLVNLVVSMGKPPDDIKLMLDWKGKSVKDAEKWAKELGMNLVVSEEKSTTQASGIILRQTPEPDTEISQGGNIEVVAAVSDNTINVSGKKFIYNVPQNSGDQKLKLTLIDASGEKEIFNGTKPGGSKLELLINPQGSARVRIFVNNVLIEEMDVE